jgi:hypothetical protein
MDEAFIMDKKSEKCKKKKKKVGLNTWSEVKWCDRLEEPQGIWWVQNGRL